MYAHSWVWFVSVQTLFVHLCMWILPFCPVCSVYSSMYIALCACCITRVYFVYVFMGIYGVYRVVVAFRVGTPNVTLYVCMHIVGYGSYRCRHYLCILCISYRIYSAILPRMLGMIAICKYSFVHVYSVSLSCTKLASDIWILHIYALWVLLRVLTHYAHICHTFSV